MKKILFPLVILAVIFNSCEKKAGVNDFGGDDELIYAIQNSDNRLLISAEELQAESMKTLEAIYIDEEVEVAIMAEGLGYEVSTILKGGDLSFGGKDRDGSGRLIYFDKNGKHLKPGKKDKDDKEQDKKVCLEILYPQTYVVGDKLVTVENEEGLKRLLTRWFNANPDKKTRPKLQYPVEVVFRGKNLTVRSEREMMRVKTACGSGKDKDKDKDKNACIEMLYPVSYLLPSGRTLTANSGEELRKMMSNWKENNPDSREKPTLVYPVNLKFKGREMEVNSEREMMRLREACAGDRDGKEKEACFDMVYPLTYKMPDGTEITRASQREMEAAIKRWYNANKTDKKPELQFPIEIKYVTDDGDQIVEIADKKALKKAYDDCGK